MVIRIRCSCGREIEAAPENAGASQRCECGLDVAIPDVALIEPAEDRAGAPAARGQETSLSEAEVANCVVVLTPEIEATKRIDGQAFSHLVTAIRVVLREFESEFPESRGTDVQVGLALTPTHALVVDIQFDPPFPSPQKSVILRRLLESMARPPVWDGPVAFVVRQPLWGGSATRTTSSFRVPFADEAKRHGLGTLDEILLKASGHDAPAARDGSSWRRRWFSFLGWWKKRPQAEERKAAPEPVEGQREIEMIDLAPAGGLDIDQLATVIETGTAKPIHYALRGELLRQVGRLEEAVADLSAAIDLDPKKAWVLASRADAHCRLDQTEPALRDANRALELEPDFFQARWLRAWIYTEIGVLDKAVEDCRAACALRPRLSYLRVNLGETLLKQGRPEESASILDEALRLDPHDPVAHAVRAMALSHGDVSNERSQAILAHWDAAVRLAPDDVRYYLGRAEILLSQNELERTIADCDRAIELGECTGHAHGLRGIAKHRTGDNHSAIADCSFALSHVDDAHEVRLARAAAYNLVGNHELALLDVDQVIAARPDHAGALHIRAIVHMSTGTIDDAIGDLNATLELAPEWYLPYVNRANCRRFQGDVDGALADCGRAIEIAPTVASPYLIRGSILAAKRKFEEAIAEFDRCLELAPDAVAAFLERATCLMMLARHPEAIADLDRAIELDSDCAPAYFHRGNARLHTGDNDAALDDFESLIRLCPTLGPAYSGRGTAWIQKGEYDRAADDYREAIECDPESAEQYMIQRFLVEASDHLRHERFREAIERAGEAIEIAQECGPAYSLRGAAHWYHGEFVAAIDDYSRVIAIEGDSFAAYSARGQVYAELGEFEAALEDLNHAIELAGTDEAATYIAYAYSGRALAYAGLDRFDESFADLRRSITDCPENAWVHYNQGLTYQRIGELSKAAACFELSLQLTEPALPPRKRNRALAFLERQRSSGQTENSS